MSDWALALVPHYGVWLLASVTFLSCLALPVPSSILMLAAGGFAASGDLVLWQAMAAALVGALLGDQVGYAAGRLGGPPLVERLSAAPQRAALLARARAMMLSRGLIAIFLTRWLFSPVGPYANLAAGASGYGWRAFTLGSLAGEAVWVTLYTGTGHAFADNLEAASDLLSSALGLVGGLAAVVVLGLWLLHSVKAKAE
jgi:membrane-associated protein